MVHPTGVTHSSRNNVLRGLTRYNVPTEIRRVRVLKANLFDPSPGLKCKAPDLAATGSSASNAYLPTGEEKHTTANRVRIVGTLYPRWGVRS